MQTVTADYLTAIAATVRTIVKKCEIVFVDNGSVDGTREYLDDLAASRDNVVEGSYHGTLASNV